jgi:glycosyltransferase involved in cell wall biosynthesis
LESSARKESIVITFVGRLLKVKGVSYLIEVLEKIQGDFTVLIVGSGPDESDLKGLVDKKRLDKKVRFLGFRKDVPEILTATDIFVLPSLSEGISISLLEAKAAGCACVVTDIGLPVVMERTALVVKPEDADSLAAAIERLITDNNLRKKLGENAKRDALENYEWGSIIKKYQEIFTAFMK